jgi:hypothetical protein
LRERLDFSQKPEKYFSAGGPGRGGKLPGFSAAADHENQCPRAKKANL